MFESLQYRVFEVNELGNEWLVAAFIAPSSAIDNVQEFNAVTKKHGIRRHRLVETTNEGDASDPYFTHLFQNGTMRKAVTL